VELESGWLSLTTLRWSPLARGDNVLSLRIMSPIASLILKLNSAIMSEKGVESRIWMQSTLLVLSWNGLQFVGQSMPHMLFLTELPSPIVMGMKNSVVF